MVRLNQVPVLQLINDCSFRPVSSRSTPPRVRVHDAPHSSSNTFGVLTDLVEHGHGSEEPGDEILITAPPTVTSRRPSRSHKPTQSTAITESHAQHDGSATHGSGP